MSQFKEESPLVQLARKSISCYLKNQKKLDIPTGLPTEWIDQPAGVFVSLKKDGQLRGCIGTFLPTQDNIAMEVIKNAVAAATMDPRFPPLDLNELDSVKISVDVLSPPEPVKDTSHLDPKKYGVIVVSGNRKGLLLPDLEGVDTVNRQIDIARQKAGIPPNMPYSIQRFKVERYK